MQTGLAELLAWFARAETRGGSLESFIAMLAAKLNEVGIPAWRLSCSVRTKHPELYIINCVWSEEKGASLRLLDHDVLERPFFLASPGHLIYGGQAETVRCVLTDAEQASRFPITEELRGEGGTDYLAMRLTFSDAQASFFSVTTRAPGGFSEAGVELLHGMCDSLATIMELKSVQHAQAALLATYLGTNAATRVLDGAFRRGTGQLIEAVIWSCDLRGFTRRADQRPVAEVLGDLDEYFAIVTEPIHANGGEVLKFVGDAVLAVFSFEALGKTACTAALTAAKQAIAAGAEHNVRRSARGLDEIRFGIGLHRGTVMYGNVGAKGRLDFTVIGAAVNETCRIESLCKKLGTPLLVSASVAAELGNAELVSLGAHALQGVEHPLELFTLASP
jgi:adenylate cyclase